MVFKTLAIRQEKTVRAESKETLEVSPVTGESFEANTQGEGSQ